MKRMTTRKLLSVFLVLALVLCIAPTVQASSLYFANDDDPNITYHGSWIYYQDPAFYSGDEHFSDTAGDYAEFTFEGNNIQWIGATSNNLGLAYVLIDGEVQGSVIDLYSPTLETEKVLFSADFPDNSQHTIRIYVAGGHHPSSTGSYVTIDAFEIVRSIDPSNPGVETSRVPEFDRVSEGDTVVSGTGVPDAEVTVYLPNGSDIVRIVGPDGRWSVPSTILRTGQIVGAVQVELNKLPSAGVTTLVYNDFDTPSAVPTVDPISASDLVLTGQGISGSRIVVHHRDSLSEYLLGETSIAYGTDQWTIQRNWSNLNEGDELKVYQVEPGKSLSEPVIVTVQAG